MAPIRLGFVGLSADGWASASLAPQLLQPPLSSKYRITAVSTSSPESAEKSAKKYSELVSNAVGEQIKVKPYHGSTANISADPDIDMVAVSIKTMMHKEAAMNVIEAGKDLFLEWPAGRNAKETEELYEAAKKKGIKTFVGTQFRASAYALKAKSIIDSGKIGKVISTTLITSFAEIPIWSKVHVPNTAYLSSASNGAGMLDIGGGHPLDMLQYVLGPVASLSSTTYNPFPESELLDPKDFKPTGQKIPQDIPTQVAASGLLRDNTVFSFHFQSGVGKKAVRFLWLIDGEEGNIRIEEANDHFFSSNPDLFLNGEKIELEKDKDENGMIKRTWDAFADGRVDEYASLEDALRNRRLVDAIKESGITGKKIVL